MVQTEQQYTFTHYAILEAITYGNTSCVLTEFRKCLERLQQVNGESGQTLLSEEFDRLGTVKTMVKKSSFQQRIKRKGAPPRHFDSSCEWEWFSSTHTHRVACKFHPKRNNIHFWYLHMYSFPNGMTISDGSHSIETRNVITLNIHSNIDKFYMGTIF